MMTTEVDEFMKKVQTHKKVLGSLIVNKEGVPLKTTMDQESTDQYAGLISELSEKACNVIKDLDPTDDLTFIRMHSKKHEIMVAPDTEKGFRLIVIQSPSK